LGCAAKKIEDVIGYAFNVQIGLGRKAVKTHSLRRRNLFRKF
jgi:hypothetical protein